MNHQLAKLEAELLKLPDTRIFPNDFGQAYKGEDAALMFVELLTGWCDSPVYWRILQDDKSANNPYKGKQKHIGMLDQHQKTFEAAQKKGASPFLIVNGGGQNDDDISEYRAVFIDVDDTAELSEIEWHIRPDFIVKRDDTHFHAYWLVRDFTRNQFVEAQKRLAEHYRSDKSIHNASRVMRVPGFLHLKDSKNPCSTVLYDLRPDFGPDEDGKEIHLLPKTFEHIVSGLPSLPPEPEPSESVQTGEPVTEQMFRDMLSYIHPDLDGDQNRWLGIAKCIRWDAPIYLDDGETPNENIDRDQLLDDWCSGLLMKERTKKDPKVTLYVDRDELMKRVNKSRHSGSKTGLGTIIQLAKTNGYTGPTRIIHDAEQDSRVREVVERINDRYAMMIGGANAGKILDLKNPASLVMLTKSDFHTIHANKREYVLVNDTPKLKTHADLWISHTKRREYEDIGFAPHGMNEPDPLPKSHYNLWRGFAIEPKEGDAHVALVEHIRTVVCRKNEELFHWFMSWLADMVQRPGAKPKTAVALRGKPGAGKSVIAEYFCKIFGPHSTTLSQQKDLTGQFNWHMANAVFVSVEEAFFSGDKSAKSRMKALITQETLDLEKKFVDRIELPNFSRFLITSNEKWAVPADPGDRRWFILDVDGKYANDKTHFEPIQKAKNGDGPACLLNYLLNYAYDPAILLHPPMTEAKTDIALMSGDTIDRWLFEVLNGQRLGHAFTDEGEGQWLSKTYMFEDYLNFCEKRKGDYAIANSQYWRSMKEIFEDALSEQNVRVDNSRQRQVRLVSLVEAKEEFARHIGNSVAAVFEE